MHCVSAYLVALGNGRAQNLVLLDRNHCVCGSRLGHTTEGDLRTRTGYHKVRAARHDVHILFTVWQVTSTPLQVTRTSGYFKVRAARQDPDALSDSMPGEKRGQGQGRTVT